MEEIRELLETLIKPYADEEVRELLLWLKKRPNDLNQFVYRDALARLLELRWYVELASFIYVDRSKIAQGKPLKCRVVGIVNDKGEPVNLPTFDWILELEKRIERLEKKRCDLENYVLK